MQISTVKHQTKLSESCEGREESTIGKRGVKDSRRTQPPESTWICRCSHGAGRLQVSDLGLLHTDWVAWCSCGISNSEDRACSDSFCLLVEHFSSYWVASFPLDAMMYAQSYSCFLCYVWLMYLGGLLFSEEGKRGVDMAKMGGRSKRLERREGGKLCSVVIYERRIKKFQVKI